MNEAPTTIRLTVVLLCMLACLACWASGPENVAVALGEDLSSKSEPGGRQWSADDYPIVSIIALIANPELFDGRDITVWGYIVRRSDEDDYLGVPMAVFTEEASAMVPLRPNGLVVLGCDPSTSDSPCLMSADEGYGLVSGRFSADVSRRFRYSGIIHEVARLELLPPWLLRDGDLRERQEQRVTPQ